MLLYLDFLASVDMLDGDVLRAELFGEGLLEDAHQAGGIGAAEAQGLGIRLAIAESLYPADIDTVARLPHGDSVDELGRVDVYYEVVH